MVDRGRMTFDEDAADVATYDSRKIELSADDIWPPEASALMLQGDRRLAALRKWRKLDQAELARAAGIAPEVLSELERGDRRAGAETTEALALALNLPAAWLAD